MPSLKRCTKCGEVKVLDDFHRDKRVKDGRRPECKECKRERDRRYREENREQARERQRRHYEENQLSRAMATVPPGTAWTMDEDTELLADDGRTIYQKAIDLGRTHEAANGRRARLLKATQPD